VDYDSHVSQNLQQELHVVLLQETWVCENCFNASNALIKAKRAQSAARERFMKLVVALGKNTHWSSSPHQNEQQPTLLVSQPTEQAVLKNAQDLLSSLWQYSPLRPELLHYLGRGLTATQVSEVFGVSERTAERCHELKHDLMHSRLITLLCFTWPLPQKPHYTW
jgi:hypothetical protein